MPQEDLFAAYEQHLSVSRTAFSEGRFGRDVLAGQPSERSLLLFLLHFCSLGVQMTTPVESWIRRAGEKTRALGMEKLGVALMKHARHEAGHEKMMIEDTKSLCKRWEQTFGEYLNPDDFINAPASPGVAAYARLHEDIIAGPTPYAQIAIEYEIEQLSVDFGPRFIGRCVEILGASITECLSFVTDHTAIDVGHTKFNRTQMKAFLEEHPSALPALIDTGSKALTAYKWFLDDCATATERALAIAA